MAGKINIKRWIDVVFLGFVSFIVVVVLSHIPFLKQQFSAWAYLISNLDLCLRYGIYVLLIFSVVLILRKFYVANPKRLKNINLTLYYPSITLSILICGSLLVVYTDYFSIVTTPFIHAYFSVFLFLYIFLLFFLYSYETSIKRSDTDAKSGDEDVTVPKWLGNNKAQIDFYKWINSEKSINDEKHDKSNRKIYSERIAQKLKNKEARNHICLVGPFGSGKTSIWEMASNSLGDTDTVFVPVDGWGRANESAAAQIIDEIIYKLSEYVDCAAVKTIPEEYMDALSGADFTGSNSLAKILTFHQRKSPKKLMEKIDTVLSSIGKRFVVVLEDFDRNPDSEKGINEIAALLDRLKKLKSIDFILCISPNQHSNILSRVSTHREDVIDFDSQESISGLIDLMELYAEKNNIELIYSYKHYRNIADPISGIINTPRELKYILRRSWSAWQVIAGEVDIYDLIAINVFRYSSPDVLNLIGNNFNKFQDGINDTNDPITTELSNSCANLDIYHVQALIKMMFPNWNKKAGVPMRPSLFRLNGSRGHIYFHRIISESFDKNYSNQKLIHNLRALDIDNEKSLDCSSKSISEIAASNELSNEFYGIIDLPNHSPQIVLSDLHVSELNICRFIIARHEYIILDNEAYIIKSLLKSLNISPHHVKEMMNILLIKDLAFAQTICSTNEVFLDSFHSIYFDSNVDICSRIDQFIHAIKSSEADNRIYNAMRVSNEHHILYIDFLTKAFLKSPLETCPHLLSTLNLYVVSSNPVDRDLWRSYKEILFDAFDRYPTSEFYHRQLAQVKEQWI